MSEREETIRPGTQTHHFPPYLTEDERCMRDDYEWALHDEELRRKYAGLVVAVSGRKVWGVGENHLAAWEAAQQVPGCPSEYRVAAVPIVGPMWLSPDPDYDPSV